MNPRPHRGLELALGAVLFLGVIAYFPASNVSLLAGKQVLVDVGLLAILGLWLPGPWLRAFYWWSLLVLAKRFNPYSIAAFYTMTLYIFTFALAVRKLRPEQLPRIETWIRVITLIQLGLMGLQVIGKDPIFTDLPHEVLGAGEQEGHFITGFLGNTMMAGTYLAVVAPLFLKRWWTLGLILLLPGIWVTGSEGSMISALLVLGWTGFILLRGWKWRRWLGWAAAAGTVALALAMFSFGPGVLPWVKFQELSRGVVWLHVVKLIELDPWMMWTGWGWGQFAPAFQGIVKHLEVAPQYLSWTRAHNDYLQLAFEGGLVALALAVGFVLSLLWGVRRRTEPGVVRWLGSTYGWLLVASWSFPAQIAGLNVVGLVLFIGLWILGDCGGEVSISGGFISRFKPARFRPPLPLKK